MKLYYSPGSCALAPHIVLCELGLAHELEKVDLKSHTTADDVDYYSVNPKGYVPALQFDDGRVLTEGPAIAQYLADQKPEAGLLPPAGSIERARVHEWLTFTGTELHKNFSTLFNPSAAEEWKAAARGNLEKRFGYVDQALQGRQYLLGDQFSIADAYLFVVSGWAGVMQIDMAAWPALTAFRQRVSERPAVQEAMRAEGLLK